MIRTFNRMLLVILWGGAVVLWMELPRRIPIHFNWAGHPDRWVDKGVVSWFLLPCLALVFAVILHAFGAWTERNPESLDLPFPRISEEERRAMAKRCRWFAEGLGTLSILAFGIMEAKVFRIATGHTSSILTDALKIIVMGGIPLLAILLLVSLYRVRAKHHDSRAETDGASPNARSDQEKSCS